MQRLEKSDISMQRLKRSYLYQYVKKDHPKVDVAFHGPKRLFFVVYIVIRNIGILRMG